MPTTYAIPNGRTVMDATLYTGNGATQTVINSDLGTVGFKPDLVWVKTRSNPYSHNICDSVRGATKNLQSNSTAAEGTGTDGSTTAFNSNGFTVSGNAETGLGSNNYVAWQWQAGQGTTSNNTSGTVTSTVSANTTAGFSIATFTTPGSSGYFTVGHGLGTTPAMVIMKPRSASGDGWVVYHQSMGSPAYNYFALLNTTAAATNAPTIFGAAPTSTTFQFNAGSAMSLSSTCVMYSWAAIPGFSAFGSYTGNGSTDGPFIYTGFRPRFLMVKRTNTTDDWMLFDSARDTYNAVGYELYPNLSAAEGNAGPLGGDLDFVSNGFKFRRTATSENANGSTYIYAAFAENPFKYANAR